ncbi:MAG: hypothetical protein M1556_01145 [Candidatus Thermoplasmatota archaeon]|nr:hypothetical protein [Candidatus Thermoplasmatota archaeon]MCL6002240.1 hypothetical protein [Candidatus Thermoplasmatota archaeon]
MKEHIRCRKCGETFKKPVWGRYPMEGSGGAKAPYLVRHGAVIACPKCGFEGPLEEYDALE